MRRIGLIAVLLVATAALSGAMASTSMAKTCVRVDESRTGSWADSLCTKAQAAGEYVKIQHLITPIPGGQWCAEVEQNEKGTYKDPECVTKSAEGRFIKVWPYQHWQIKEELLPQGTTKQIKLQLKGIAKLTAPELKLTIECLSSSSEGATIESQGKDRSGQGKGRITYKECKTSVEECKVAEPITTNQTKSHLALSETTAQGKLVRPVVVFSPTEGKTFVELNLTGSGCGVRGGKMAVQGSVAAEIGPEGGEVKEGLSSFPAEAIKEVYNEQGKETLKLTIGASGIPTTFSAIYGSQLASGEAFGVGG